MMVVDFPDFLMLTLCRVYNAVVMKFVIILFRQCGDFIFFKYLFRLCLCQCGDNGSPFSSFSFADLLSSV